MTVHPEYYDDEEENDEPTPPVPPDGGWGWVVVLASLLCNIIVDGVCFSFGIFFVSFVEEFGESRTKTAWVGSLLAGCYLTMGPITSALANKFGCRRVTIAGSVIAAAAFVLCTFSPNLDILIITYGIMGGIGFGLIYLPAIVIVGFYFEKRRAFATGVAVCGSGIGTFVFAPLSRLLLETYDWKGGTLIIAGIILNGVVCGALFRPLEPRRRKRRKICEEDLGDPIKKCIIMQKLIEEKKRQRTISTHSLDNMIITRDNRLIKDLSLLEPTKPEKVRSIRDILRETFSPSRASLNRSRQAIPSIVIDSTVCSRATRLSEPVTPDSGVSAGQSGVSIGTADGSPQAARLASVRQLGGSCVIRISPKNSPEQIWRRYGNSSPQITGVTDPEEKLLDVSRPMYRRDIFYSGSVMDLPEFVRSHQDVEEYVNSITDIPPEQYSKGLCSCLPKSMRDVLGAMLDIQLLTSPTFLVLCLSSVLAMLGFFIPFVFIADYAYMSGVSMERGSYLLSILGVTNTVGRVVSGFVTDRSWADCLLINNLALIIAGVCTALVPLLIQSYELLAMYCSVFGLCIAAFVSLRSIVLVDLLGLEKLTNAFGLLILFQGLASIVGTPLHGWFYNDEGQYSVPFYLAGTLIAVSGLVCLPLRRVARWEEKRRIAKAEALAQAEGSEYSGESEDLQAEEDYSQETVL